MLKPPDDSPAKDAHLQRPLPTMSHARALALAFMVVIAGSLLFGASGWAQGGAGAVPATAEPVADRIISFINAGPSVRLLVDGVGSVQLKQGQRISVATRADRIRYTVSHGQEWQYGGDLQLSGILERVVTLTPPLAYLRIVNRSDEVAEVRLHGERLGVLPRAGSRSFGPLPAGEATLVAIGQRSRAWSLLRTTLRAGITHTAILPPAPAGLVVKNVLKEPARVTIDHRNFGVVDPGAEVHVLGLVPSSHDVALHGIQTGQIWRQNSLVSATGVRTAASGQLLLNVHNKTGETLKLPAALGGLFDKPLAPGDQVIFTMARKAVRVLLEGQSSGLRYVHDVAENPAQQSWTIYRPTGELRLTNGTGEAATVAIEGVGDVSLRPNQIVQLRRVPAGQLKLSVTTRQSAQVFTRGVSLEPGADIAWVVTAGRASLLLVNGWPEPVAVTIDGAPRGIIDARASFRIGNIRPGAHRVAIRTMQSGRTGLSLVEVVDGRQTRQELRPPDGTLRVTNRSDDAYDVFIQGRRAGRVEAGKTHAFSVAPGRINADVRAVGSHRSASWRGALAPAQHIHLPTPSARGGTLSLHNPLSEAVEVLVDQRPAATIAAGKRVQLTSLSPGTHLIEVRAASFVQRQRVVVKDGLPPVTIELVPALYKLSKKSVK